MNSTFGATAANTWKRITVQHISALCGIAIAASAAVALGGWQGDGGSASRPGYSGNAGISVSSPDERPEVAVYMVVSQEQADRAAALEAQRFADRTSLGVEARFRTMHVLFAGTEAGQAAAEKLISETSWVAEGVSFTYIDLRKS